MNFAELMSKEWVKLIGMLLIGITIGALFYPTKHIEEKLTQKHMEELQKYSEERIREVTTLNEMVSKLTTESKIYKEESERKYSMLKIENKELKSKQKTAYYKLIKPDGTIEIKRFTESEVNESTKVITSIQEEFKKKVESIENKYALIHTNRVLAIKKEFESKESEYKKTIEELTRTKTTTINEKRFNGEVGMMTNKDYYVHATAGIWGPFTLGLHAELKQFDPIKQQPQETVTGAGIGFSF